MLSNVASYYAIKNDFQDFINVGLYYFDIPSNGFKSLYFFTIVFKYLSYDDMNSLYEPLINAFMKYSLSDNQMERHQSLELFFEIIQEINDPDILLNYEGLLHIVISLLEIKANKSRNVIIIGIPI